jgi:His-Xaa-Ser system protein HxsD
MNGVSHTPDGHSLLIDPAVYGVEAVKKAAYKFADRASVIINGNPGSKTEVIFNFVGQHAKNNPEQIISDFCNELLDQELREVIKKETGALRNALIAHAFSQTLLTERD